VDWIDFPVRWVDLSLPRAKDAANFKVAHYRVGSYLESSLQMRDNITFVLRHGLAVIHHDILSPLAVLEPGIEPVVY